MNVSNCKKLYSKQFLLIVLPYEEQRLQFVVKRKSTGVFCLLRVQQDNFAKVTSLWLLYLLTQLFVRIPYLIRRLLTSVLFIAVTSNSERNWSKGVPNIITIISRHETLNTRMFTKSENWHPWSINNRCRWRNDCLDELLKDVSTRVLNFTPLLISKCFSQQERSNVNEKRSLKKRSASVGHNRFFLFFLKSPFIFFTYIIYNYVRQYQKFSEYLNIKY